jgi:hypothetical protein
VPDIHDLFTEHLRTGRFVGEEIMLILILLNFLKFDIDLETLFAAMEECDPVSSD